MLAGNALEAQLVKQILSDMHWSGLHLRGTQVQVGGTDPAWDGNLDALMYDDEAKETFVLEIKTKSGYGADLLYRDLIPSDEYLAQLGLYLRDLSSKGVATRGCLLYVLLSDSNFGRILQFNCSYDEKTKLITCYEAVGSDGLYRELNITFDTELPLKRWRYLDECIAKKEMPKGEFRYKHPVTEEMLAAQSDANLRKMFEGTKVVGDWQALYSGYLDANLAADGEVRGYTAEELKMITREYLTRHPKSKMGYGGEIAKRARVLDTMKARGVSRAEITSTFDDARKTRENK